MYKVWRLGRSVLGIVCPLKQIAFGIGVRWHSYKGTLYGIYVWLDIGPLHIWFAWGRPKA